MVAAVDVAYDAIRKGISRGRFASGMHLSTEDLAQEFGISRTPVREALRRLAAEGLVDIFANRGAYVSSWSQQDAEEVFALRVLLESHAAEQSALRLTELEIKRLNQLADEMEALPTGEGGHSLDVLTHLNGEFHRLIISAAANRRLSTTIASVVERSLVTRTFESYSSADLQRSMAHHRELISAFRARDGAWAAAVMKSHIQAAYHVYRNRA